MNTSGQKFKLFVSVHECLEMGVQNLITLVFMERKPTRATNLARANSVHHASHDY